jgi:hypothetical protein
MSARDVRRLSGSRFQCPYCAHHFAGPLSLDRHRADLQCLSVDGLHAAGLSLNASGFWTIERSAPPQSLTAPIRKRLHR